MLAQQLVRLGCLLGRKNCYSRINSEKRLLQGWKDPSPLEVVILSAGVVWIRVQGCFVRLQKLTLRHLILLLDLVWNIGQLSSASRACLEQMLLGLVLQLWLVGLFRR